MQVKTFALVLVFLASFARAWHGEDVPGTCEALCRAAGDQCSTAWTDEKTTCLLSFPDTTVQPDSLQHSREVTATVAYHINKDVLANLIQRYKVLQLNAELANSHEPSTRTAKNRAFVQKIVLRYGVKLCLPRTLMFLEWVTGTSMLPSLTCCHQQCVWENMFQGCHNTDCMPSLKSLLERSIALRQAQLLDPGFCQHHSTNSPIQQFLTTVRELFSLQWSSKSISESIPAWLSMLSSGPRMKAQLWLLVVWLVRIAVPELAMAYDFMRVMDAVIPGAQAFWIGYAVLATRLAIIRARHLHGMLQYLNLPRDEMLLRFTAVAAVELVVATITIVASLFASMLADVEISTEVFATLQELLVLSVFLLHSRASDAIWKAAMHACNSLESSVQESQQIVNELQQGLAMLTQRRGGAVAAASSLNVGATPGASTSNRPAVTPQAVPATASRLLTLRRQRQAENARQAANNDTASQSYPLGISAERMSTPLSWELMNMAIHTVTGRMTDSGAHGIDLGDVMSVYDELRLLHDASSDGGGTAEHNSEAEGVTSQQTATTTQGRAPLHNTTGLRLRHVAAAARIRQAADATRPSISGSSNNNNNRASGEGPAASTGTDRPRVDAGNATTNFNETTAAPLHVRNHGLRLPLLAARAAALGVRSEGLAQRARAQTPSERQSAAQAAMDAVHWPPPLDLPSWVDELPDVPQAFRCPITLALMREPTQASSGVTYERSAIFQWLQDNRGNKVDPITQVPLKRHRLIPNLNLRHMIEEWVGSPEVQSMKPRDA